MSESTIDIQCWFIHGSDVLGCKVVLVSDYRGVNNETMNITRKTNNIMSVFGTFNLTQPVSCYNRVLAFDISVFHISQNKYQVWLIKSIQSCTCTSCRLEYCVCNGHLAIIAD